MPSDSLNHTSRQHFTKTLSENESTLQSHSPIPASQKNLEVFTRFKVVLFFLFYSLLLLLLLRPKRFKRERKSGTHSLSQSPPANLRRQQVTSEKKENNYFVAFSRGISGTDWRFFLFFFFKKQKKTQKVLQERKKATKKKKKKPEPPPCACRGCPGLKPDNFIADEITATPIMFTQLPVAHSKQRGILKRGRPECSQGVCRLRRRHTVVRGRQSSAL